MPTTILETDRLALRELVPDDIEFLATMLANPDVSRFYERQFTRADAQAWLDKQLAPANPAPAPPVSRATAARRALRGRARDRARRDGDGLRRPRRAARPDGRHQGHASGARRGARRAALPRRDQDDGEPAASAHP